MSNKIPTDDELLEVVREVLDDALGAEPDEVSWNSRLGPDLGAESIDYLDIEFKLKAALENQRASFMKSLMSDNSEIEFDGNGNKVLTDTGVQNLLAKVPGYSQEDLDADRTLRSIQDQFSVRHLVSAVRQQLLESKNS